MLAEPLHRKIDLHHGFSTIGLLHHVRTPSLSKVRFQRFAMTTSTPLFNALASAKFTHKYEVVWAELSGAEFNTKTKAWLKLLGKVIGGPSSKERKALAQEFLQFLYVYKQMLEKLTRGTHSPEPAQVMQKMNDFNAEYKRNPFRTPSLFDPHATSPTAAARRSSTTWS